MIVKKPARVALTAGVASGLIIGGAFGSVALAQSIDSQGGGVEPPEPSYSANDSGLTYGSSLGAAVGSEPDLILVLATNGEEGYVYATDLRRVDGTEAAEAFKSPEDALVWQESQKNVTDHERTIPVFAEDGKTEIGVFVVSAGAAEVVKGP